MNLRSLNNQIFTLKTLQIDPDSTIYWILKDLLVTSQTTTTKTRQKVVNILSTFPSLVVKTVITQILVIAKVNRRRKKTENAPSMTMMNLQLKVMAH